MLSQIPLEGGMHFHHTDKLILMRGFQIGLDGGQFIEVLLDLVIDGSQPLVLLLQLLDLLLHRLELLDFQPGLLKGVILILPVILQGLNCRSARH